MSEATIPRSTRILLFVLLLVLLAGVGEWTGVTRDLSADKVRESVHAAGPWGIALYLVLFAVGTTMQAPGMMFVAAAILAYGNMSGFFIAHAGAVVAVSVNYGLGRCVGGDVLDKFKKRMRMRLLQRLFEQLDHRPIATIMILRILFQIAPPMNYALALYGVRYRDYLIGSVVGLVPPILGATLLFDWMFS